MSLESWLAFVAVWTLVGLPLGPNAVNTMTATVRHGFVRGWMVPLGIGIAGIAHAFAALLGFGALMLASAELFTAVKLAGAAYLLWLAWRLWSGDTERRAAENSGRASRARLFRRGFLVSLSNPKAILVYVAAFPQFFDPAQALAPQLAVMMPTMTAITLAIYTGYAALAAPLGRWLTSARRVRTFNRTAASFYGATAFGLVFADRR